MVQLAPLEEGGVEGPAEDPAMDAEIEAKVAVVPLRAPAAPTAEEIEEHEASGHCNYRSWCRACIAGRGRSNAHVAADSDEHALPTVAIDYAYLGDPTASDEEKASPILVLKSAKDRWISSEVYPAKGVQHEWCAKRLGHELAMVPWNRFVLKSDQEPAIVSLKNEAVKVMMKLNGKSVVLEESPVGDSESNGLAEGAVKEAKGVIRSLRFSLEDLHGIEISHSSAILPWLVRHAGSMISRGRRGIDGRTAFELRRGKPYRRKLPPFGEKVMWLKAGKPKSRLEDRWKEGLFLGVQDRSDEVVVGTRDGVFKARSVKRLDGVQRRDASLVQEMKGVPWQPIPIEQGGSADMEVPAIFVAAAPVVKREEIPEVMEPQEPLRRSLYVRKADIEKFGMTPGCPGCTSLLTGGKVVHSAACRARIEEKTRESGDVEMIRRVDEARARKRALQEAAGPPSPAQEGQREEMRGVEDAGGGGAAGGAASSGSAGVDEEGARDAKRVRAEAREEMMMVASMEALGEGDTTDIMEIFCPDRFTSKASAFGLKSGVALDLRTGWNLNDPVQVAKAWALWEETQPRFLVLSPMCKAFSTLQNLNKGSVKYEEVLKEGINHLKMCMEFAEAQRKRGGLFLFEHPWSAWSWKLGMVKHVMEQEGVLVVEGHQCAYGQSSVDPDGVRRLVKKPTGWMTNSALIAEVLAKRCANERLPLADHHQHALMVGGRAAPMERYPPRLVTAVLKALRNEMILAGCVCALEVGQTLEEEELVVSAAKGGPYQEIFDRVTGQALDTEGVAKARAEEMEYMRQLKVFEYVTEEEARACTGRAPISVDWVDVNKGDDRRPELRSRLVAQETRRVSTLGPEDVAAVFAATPPLEALRFLLSRAVTEDKEDRQAETVLIFLDISRAHLHSPVRREVFVRACAEDVDCPAGCCWKLLKAMYGLRDAGASFDKKVETIMESRGYAVGLFNPCLCFEKVSKVGIFRHGDDFVVHGGRGPGSVFVEELKKELIVKVRGVLGPRREMGDVDEMVILNRIVRWVPARGASLEYISIEADARHVQVLAQQLGLTEKSKAVGTPGVRQSGPRGDELDAERRQVFRSATMRLAYLSQDRPEIAYASKETARCMSCPDEAAWIALKRAARFCMGRPRVIWKFEKQGPVTVLDVWSDSDHAGCTRTRRSTSCSALMVGRHLLKFTSTTQTVIALSSGESEFYGLVKSVAIGLGAKAMAKDLGVELAVRVRYDATAGAGIANRRGVGRVRHLDTQALWIQRHIQEGRVKLTKVLGTDNAADLGTKHLDAAAMWKLLGVVGVQAIEGRSAKALEICGGTA